MPSFAERDIKYMKAALLLARLADADGEIPVGAVVVRGDEIIGEGRNRREKGDATAHAEMEAISAACRRLGDWRLTGCELFVTLEPCAMCAGAAINARLDRIVYASAEPNTGCCGSVCNLFAMRFSNSPAITAGVCADESGALLKAFFGRGTKKR